MSTMLGYCPAKFSKLTEGLPEILTGVMGGLVVKERGIVRKLASGGVLDFVKIRELLLPSCIIFAFVSLHEVIED